MNAQTLHPAMSADPGTTTRHRSAGLAVGVVGLAVVLVGLGANIVASGLVPTDPTAAEQILLWSFGASTTGFAILKAGIAAVLVGITFRLWIRVGGVKSAIARLKPPSDPAAVTTGEIDTPFGAARATRTVPPTLRIHRMATTMWRPALAMGAMLVAVGLIASIAGSGQTPGTAAFNRLSAWSQGTLFLGEGLLLAGISFLLGTILRGLREGGGLVQEESGVAIKTLEMPASAKGFIVLMMLGVMMALAQFAFYAYAATSLAADPTTFAVWTTWLAPFREAALGVLLAAIVLALYTISKVLGFQFSRIREIVSTGI